MPWIWTIIIRKDYRNAVPGLLTNSVMMPIAALMTSLFVSKVVGVDRMEEEIRHGESKFRRKKIFVVMIKYLCPIFAIIILVSSVANAFGWISM